MNERPFIPGDDDEAVLGLRQRVWGADHPHNNPAYYNWLFRQSPSGIGSGIVAVHDEVIVGFAGICNRTVCQGDKEIRLCHGLDFMVDPAVSGTLSGRIAVKTLNRHVDLAKDQGYDLNINFPNERSRRMIVSNRVKYAEVMQPALMVLPLSSFTASPESGDSPFKRLFMTIGGRALSLYSAARRAVHGSGKFSIDQIDGFDASFDGFWDALKSDNRLRFKRDRANLQWRFSAHPLHRYTIFRARKDGVLVGFLVMASRELMGMPASIIADLSVLAHFGGAAVDLASAAARAAKAAGSMLLATQAVPGSPESATFLKSGFLRVPSRFNPKPFMMVAHAYTDAAGPALRKENWAFSWSDMDVV